MILLLAHLALAAPAGGACVLQPSLGASVLEAVRALELDPATHRRVVGLAGAACEDLRDQSYAIGEAWEDVDSELSATVPVMGSVLRATSIAAKLDAEREQREMTFVVEVATTIGPDAWASVLEALAAEEGAP